MKKRDRVKVKTKRVNKNKDAKGRWLPGCDAPNPLGRPKGAGTKLDSLMQSISRVEGKVGKNLLDHYVTTAFKDHSVLISIMKKLVPDLKALEVVAGTHEQMSDDMAESIQNKLTERWGQKNAK